MNKPFFHYTKTSARNRIGFDTSGKYIEKLWVSDPSLPHGGAWRPMP